MENKKTDNPISEIIKAWKDKGIAYGEMEFSCGGDQMNDTELKFYDEKHNVVEFEYENYFNDDVYRSVDFYVNSDGHYIGEFGHVRIELNGEEGEDEDFQYSKNSSSEWSENHLQTEEFYLTVDEVDYINNYVHSIFGEGNEVNINYKKDFIQTDEMVKLDEELKEKISSFVMSSEPENFDGDWDEDSTYTRFTTDSLTLDDSTIKVVDNKLSIRLTFNCTVTKED